MQRYFMVFKGNEVYIFPYNPREHRGYKFLYFIKPDGGEVLLVSGHPFKEHKLILENFNLGNPGALDIACLKGAGYIKQGEVDEWHSLGFNLFTPSDLAPRILELLELRR